MVSWLSVPRNDKETEVAETVKNAITIKTDIRPGPVTPHMRRAWVTFWKRLIADANKREVSK